MCFVAHIGFVIIFPSHRSWRYSFSGIRIPGHNTNPYEFVVDDETDTHHKPSIDHTNSYESIQTETNRLGPMQPICIDQ